jgi:hypothetical protein
VGRDLESGPGKNGRREQRRRLIVDKSAKRFPAELSAVYDVGHQVQHDKRAASCHERNAYLAKCDLFRHRERGKQPGGSYGLSGNICRCGTYVRIREAIKQAAQSSGQGG